MKLLRLTAFILATLIFLLAIGCSSTEVPKEHPEDGKPNENEDESKNESSDPKEESKMNILFLGNSLIFYNDMPSIFDGIAKAAGKNVFVDSVTKGSATISDFASKETTVGQQLTQKLLERKWDYIIIEPSRRITPYENSVLEAEIASAKTIQRFAESSGAEILLYSVWGNNTGNLTIYTANSPTNIVSSGSQSIPRGAHARFMYETAELISGELGGVKIIKSGYAFENLLAEHPDINLYHADERHPSPEGSYLAACTVFSTIFGEKTEGNGYNFKLASAKKLQKASDATVIDKLVPKLPEIPERPLEADVNILVLGSNLMSNYNMFGVLNDITSASDGKILSATTLLSSTFVCNMLVNESTDLGMRKALNEKEWDAIVIQLSRRCTLSSSDVAASELAALKSIWGLLSAETDKIYIMTLNSDANPAIFTTDGGNMNYTKTSKKESCTAAEGSEFFKTLAESFISELGGGDTILYGSAYTDYTSGRTKAGVGYLQAACLYNKIFGKAIPSDCTATNGLDANTAAALRAIAEKHCPTK